MMDWPLMRINHVLPSHQFQSRWHPPFWRSRVCAINNDNVMAKSCLLWQFKSVLIAPRIFFSKWNIFHLFFTGGSFTGQCVWFFLYIFLYTFPSFKEYFLKKENRNFLRFEVPVSSWADGRLVARILCIVRIFVCTCNAMVHWIRSPWLRIIFLGKI